MSPEEQRSRNRDLQRARRSDPAKRAVELAAKRERRTHPDVAEKERAYEAAYNARPEVKARKREYAHRYDRVEVNRTVRERHRIKKFYGLTLEERDALLANQHGVCRLCESPVEFGGLPKMSRGAHIDHCHETGRVRGVLCGGCNATLGRLGDTPEAIAKVLAYVQGVKS